MNCGEVSFVVKTSAHPIAATPQIKPKRNDIHDGIVHRLVRIVDSRRLGAARLARGRVFVLVIPAETADLTPTLGEVVDAAVLPVVALH